MVYDLSFLPELSEHEAETARLNAETNIANILQRAGREADAKAYLQRAWAQYPNFPTFAIDISYYLIKDNRIPEALDVLNEGIEGLQTYPQTRTQAEGKLYLNRGSVLQVMGCCDLANRDYGRALKTDADIHVTLCQEF